MNVKMKDEIAKWLLDTKAFIFRPKEPFTWASGIKSPVYCDNRILLSHPNARREVIEAFEQIVRTNFSETAVIAGVATAGIPHAAILAHQMELPMIYVRGELKGHGRKNRIEGKFAKGDKIVVIEDLISTGGSSVSAVSALRESAGDVLGVFAIFSYGLKKAKDTFEAAQIPFFTLTDMETLISVALRDKYIAKDDIDFIDNWRQKICN